MFKLVVTGMGGVCVSNCPQAHDVYSHPMFGVSWMCHLVHFPKHVNSTLRCPVRERELERLVEGLELIREGKRWVLAPKDGSLIPVNWAKRRDEVLVGDFEVEVNDA